MENTEKLLALSEVERMTKDDVLLELINLKKIKSFTVDRTIVLEAVSEITTSIEEFERIIARFGYSLSPLIESDIAIFQKLTKLT